MNKIIDKKSAKEYRLELKRRLLSGEYKQTIGCLRSIDGGYCCLGVAEETVWGKDIWEESDSGFKVSPHDENYDQREATRSGMPFNSTISKLGFNRGQMFLLSHMNDSGCSFAQIVAKISQWFPKDSK